MLTHYLVGNLNGRVFKYCKELQKPRLDAMEDTPMIGKPNEYATTQFFRRNRNPRRLLAVLIKFEEYKMLRGWLGRSRYQ